MSQVYLSQASQFAYDALSLNQYPWNKLALPIKHDVEPIISCPVIKRLQRETLQFGNSMLLLRVHSIFIQNIKSFFICSDSHYSLLLTSHRIKNIKLSQSHWILLKYNGKHYHFIYFKGCICTKQNFLMLLEIFLFDSLQWWYLPEK